MLEAGAESPPPRSIVTMMIVTDRLNAVDVAVMALKVLGGR